MPFAQIRNQMRLRMSASTVWRIAAEFGFHRRKARKVIYITPEQKVKRLQWAREYADWGAWDWNHVIWSDEAYVVLSD